MNKQEKIDWGLRKLIRKWTNQDGSQYLYDFSLAIRSYLDSKDVKIKVDRELPLTRIGEMLAEYKLAWKNDKGEWCYEIPVAYPPPTKEYPRTKLHIDGEWLGQNLSRELNVQKSMLKWHNDSLEPLIKEEQ